MLEVLRLFGIYTVIWNYVAKRYNIFIWGDVVAFMVALMYDLAYIIVKYEIACFVDFSALLYIYLHVIYFLTA